MFPRLFSPLLFPTSLAFRRFILGFGIGIHDGCTFLGGHAGFINGFVFSSRSDFISRTFLSNHNLAGDDALDRKSVV